MTLTSKYKDIFKVIESASGNAKIVEFNKVRKDTMVLEIVDFCLNPRLKSGIGTAKINKPVKDTVKSYATLDDVFDMIEILSDNNTGKQEIVKAIQDLQAKEPECKDFIAQIATQSLKWKLGVSSVNKAMGGNFIPVHKILKPEKLKPQHLEWLKKENQEIAIFQKEEGYRAEIKLLGNGKCAIMSSGGEQWNTTGNEWDEIEEALSVLYIKGTLSAEVVKINDMTNPLDRMTLFNQTGSVVRKSGKTSGVIMNIFDYIPDDGFDKGIYPTTLRVRKKMAKSIVEKLGNPYIRYIPALYQGFDYDMIETCFNDMITLKNEGIVICVLDSTYEGKKSYKMMMKMKTGNEADVKVLGFNIGEAGKQYENTLGTITIDYKGHEVKCSLGFKTLYDSAKYDDRLVRDYIWSHQDELIGKIVRIGYMDEIATGDSLDLRFCTIIAFRDDKSEESYN